MAGLCRLSLRVSWIFCLLISSITCFPASKGFGSYNPGSAPSGFGGWPSPGSSSSHAGSFSGPSASGSFSSGYGSNTGSGYGNTGYSNVGYGSVGTGSYDSSFESTDGAGGYVESYGGGDVDQSSGPVLSDMSDLDPVYSFRSRSGYQQGRATFSQTRYTPGEVPLPPIQLVQSSPRQPVRVPAKAPSKGGY